MSDWEVSLSLNKYRYDDEGYRNTIASSLSLLWFMSALIRLFWDICTFQRGPQDTPYSPFLFGALLFINLALGFATFLVPDGKGVTTPVSSAISYLLVDAVSSMGLVYLALWLHGHTARSLQTITTLLGIGIVITVAQLPLNFLASNAGDQVNMQTMFYLGTMVIFIWQLALYTQIFRQALSTTIFRAGGYALLMYILSFVVYFQMLPVVR
jgi:hypothetical protein